MGLVLGIDTSCYTTSLALVDTNGTLVADKRRILNVPSGSRGLQQSNAVFQHIKNLKELFDELWESAGREKIIAVAASIKPRPVEGSYMPVFTVAESYGITLAGALDVPFIPTTHQEGHVMAGLWSSEKTEQFDDQQFLAVHLSGGTTELLHISRKDEGSEYLFAIEIMGNTKDLNAGQFIDRVGVSMGLSFPAGPKLEMMAEKAIGSIKIPSSVQGYDVSFSGPETKAQQLVENGEESAEIARAVEQCIANSLEKVLRKAVEDTKIKNILVVGGVASNQYIRIRLKNRLEHPAVGAKLFFALPEMSSDNAVGSAIIGMLKHNI